MSSAGIYDGFDAYLRAMPGLPAPVISEGEAYNPQSNVPYVSSRMLAYTRRPAATGPNPVQIESGTFGVNVHRPALEGRSAANQLADAICEWFSRARGFTTADGLVVVFSSSTAQPMISAAAFLTVPVTVNWMTSSF